MSSAPASPAAERTRRIAAPRPIAVAPAAVTALLLASGGGVLAWSWAGGLVLATLLCAPALAAVARGRARPVTLGTAELAGPVFLVVYAATGALATYRGAAVPALLHAGLAYAVFRAAAAASMTPDGARRQAVAVVGIAGVVAAIAIAASLANGGPASSPAAAPFVARGHLAVFLAAALPMCVALAADTGPEDGTVSQQNGRARLLPRRVSSATGVLASRAALGLAIGGIAFSVARGGIAVAGAVLLASLALLVRLPRKSEPLPPRIVSVAAALLLPVTAAWIARGPLTARLSTGALKTSAVERVEIVRASWSAFLEHPLFGHGAGSFANAFRPLRPASVPYFVEHAHADVLELAVESGAVGVAALLIAGALVGRRLRRGRSSPIARLSLAGVLGCIALVLGGVSDFPMRLGAIACLGAWLLGIAAGASEMRAAGRRVHAPDPGDPPAPSRERAAAFAALAVLVLGSSIGLAHARAAALSNRSDEASRVRATELAPWNAGVWREAAFAAVDRALAGDPSAFDDAAARFDAALARNPLDAAAHAGRGRLAMLAGDPDRGAEAFARAVAADPLHPSWRTAHVEALLRASRFDEAQDAVGAAIRARPLLARDVITPFAEAGHGAVLTAALGDADALAILAALLADRGETPAARAAAGRASELAPIRHSALAADLASAARDDAAANAILDRALRAAGVLCGSAPRYDGAPEDRAAALGLLLRHGRLAGHAGVAAPCAVALFPDEPAAWSFAAEQSAAASGDPAFVEGAWRRAGELAPADPAPYVALSRFHAGRGNADAAMEAAREAESRSTCAGAGAREVARLLDAEGRRAAAVTHLEALAERCGSPAWISESIASLR